MVMINKPRTLGERMEKLETDIDYLKKSQDEMKIDVKSLNNNFKEELEKLNNNVSASLKIFTDSADKKYASKLTERIVYGIIGAIGLILIGLLVRLLIKYGGGLV